MKKMFSEDVIGDGITMELPQIKAVTKAHVMYHLSRANYAINQNAIEIASAHLLEAGFLLPKLAGKGRVTVKDQLAYNEVVKSEDVFIDEAPYFKQDDEGDKK